MCVSESEAVAAEQTELQYDHPTQRNKEHKEVKPSEHRHRGTANLLVGYFQFAARSSCLNST